MLSNAIAEGTTLARLIRCGAARVTARHISIRSSRDDTRGIPARSAIYSSRRAVSGWATTSLSAAEVSR
jgi:hypothetical protein